MFTSYIRMNFHFNMLTCHKQYITPCPIPSYQNQIIIWLILYWLREHIIGWNIDVYADIIRNSIKWKCVFFKTEVLKLNCKVQFRDVALVQVVKITSKVNCVNWITRKNANIVIWDLCKLINFFIPPLWRKRGYTVLQLCDCISVRPSVYKSVHIKINVAFFSATSFLEMF